MEKTLRTIISLTTGIPAFLLAFGEVPVEYTWLQLLAFGALAAIIMWNYAESECEKAGVSRA